MAHVYSTKFKTEYVVETCTYEDIPLHYALVQHLFEDTTEMDYCTNMVESINNGTAFKCNVKEELVAVMYIYKNGTVDVGSCVWSDSDALAVVTMFDQYATVTTSRKLLMPVHSGGRITLKTLVRPDSIRRYHATGKPLTLMIDTLRERMQWLFEKLRVTSWHQL